MLFIPFFLRISIIYRTNPCLSRGRSFLFLVRFQVFWRLNCLHFVASWSYFVLAVLSRAYMSAIQRPPPISRSMTRHALNSTETSTKRSTTNHKCMEVLAAICIKHSCLVSRAASGSGNLKLFKLQRPKQRSPIVGSFISEPPLLNGFENTPNEIVSWFYAK